MLAVKHHTRNEEAMRVKDTCLLTTGDIGKVSDSRRCSSVYDELFASGSRQDELAGDFQTQQCPRQCKV